MRAGVSNSLTGSDAAEAQASLLFGYTTKQRAAWLAWFRNYQAAYGCNTIYTLLTESQRKLVTSVGRRCFGPASAVDGMTFFFSLQRETTKKNAARMIPKGSVLARAGSTGGRRRHSSGIEQLGSLAT